MIRKAGFSVEKSLESAENRQITPGFGNTWPDCIVDMWFDGPTTWFRDQKEGERGQAW